MLRKILCNFIDRKKWRREIFVTFWRSFWSQEMFVVILSTWFNLCFDMVHFITLLFIFTWLWIVTNSLRVVKLKNVNFFNWSQIWFILSLGQANWKPMRAIFNLCLEIEDFFSFSQLNYQWQFPIGSVALWLIDFSHSPLDSHPMIKGCQFSLLMSQKNHFLHFAAFLPEFPIRLFCNLIYCPRSPWISLPKNAHFLRERAILISHY